jgi:hypothetical protein
MSKTATIRARVEPGLKSEVEDILDHLGLTASEMEGSPHHREIVSPIFQDINSTTGRPAAIGRMFGHQPQRRPITPAPGKLRAKFEATVFLGEKPLTFQAG